MKLGTSALLLLSLVLLLPAIPSKAAGDSDAMRAIELCKKGKAKEAIPFFDSALRQAPNDAQVLYNRALAFQNLGQTEKAIEDYSACLKLNPLSSKAYYNRALAYISKKDYTQARRDLDRVTVIDKKNADAFFNKGNIFFDTAHYEEALKNYDKAIELAPKAQIFINKANTEVRLKLFQHAVVDYGEALKLDPQTSKALLERAILYLSLGKHDLAIRDSSKFIELKSWKDEGTPYAAYIKYFASKLGKQKQIESTALKELSAQQNASGWPYDIVRYLCGKTSDKDLLILAKNDNDKLTEAHTYIGMQKLCANDKAGARQEFTWVEKQGNRLFDEYLLAMSMLRQLKAS